MKISFFELEKWEELELKKYLPKHEIKCFTEKLSEQNISDIKDSQVIGVFIYSKITKEIIDKLPKLKLIVTLSTGFDHIDTKYCRQKKITVCNVPNYGENTVAEHTFALILAISRKIYPSIKRTHEHHSFETDSTLRGFDLKEKTIGIIGYGKIGQHVCRISKGFEMNTIVYDRNPNPNIAKKNNFKYVSLDYLIKNSNIITLHVPLVEGTKHLLDKKAFSNMKKGVVIINTARGGIIDTHSLVKALRDNTVAYAGLDVIEEECEIKEEREILTKEFKTTCNFKNMLENHLLMSLDNVILTPHNAFNSKEALTRILHTTIENIKSFENKKIINSVN